MPMDVPSDEFAVLEVAHSYYRAMVDGDEEALRKLFDPRAPITGHYEGAFLWQDLESFIEEAKSLVGQHGEPDCKVEGLRIDGDIATVCVRGRYAKLWFLDHLSTVKREHGWVITNKSFCVVS